MLTRSASESLSPTTTGRRRSPSVLQSFTDKFRSPVNRRCSVSESPPSMSPGSSFGFYANMPLPLDPLPPSPTLSPREEGPEPTMSPRKGMMKRLNFNANRLLPSIKSLRFRGRSHSDTAATDGTREAEARTSDTETKHKMTALVSRVQEDRVSSYDTITRLTSTAVEDGTWIRFLESQLESAKAGCVPSREGMVTELISRLALSEQECQQQRRKCSELASRVKELESMMATVSAPTSPNVAPKPFTWRQTLQMEKTEMSFPETPTEDPINFTEFSPLKARNRPTLVARCDYYPGVKTHLQFYEGDLLFLREQTADGWWTAEDLAGKIGKVPRNYIIELDKLPKYKMIAKGDFTPDYAGDVRLWEGCQVSVLRKEDDWWIVELGDNSIGYAPSNFLEEITSFVQ